MLILDSRWIWTWSLGLVVALAGLFYLKASGWRYYRRGHDLQGIVRILCGLALALAIGILFVNFGDRGNYVWVFKESGGSLIKQEYMLFWKARLPMRDSKSLELVEGPNSFSWQTKTIVNDTGRPLSLGMGLDSPRHVTLESGLLLKTTDDFFGDADFAK